MSVLMKRSDRSGVRSARNIRPVVTVVIAAEELPCVVVGGGKVGTRKVVALVGQGATVRVVSPEVSPGMQELIEAGRVVWVRERYRPELLDGTRLVVAATSDEEINAQVARDAKAQGLLVCETSSAKRSEVFFPALLEHGPATIAVHTRGVDPGYSRVLRDHLAGLLAAALPQVTEVNSHDPG